MKATLALLGLFVLLVAGCGGGKPGPDDVADGWAKAMAAHDYKKVCSYEAPAYAGSDCATAYKQSISGSSAAYGVDIVKGLEHLGECAVVERSAYCFVTGPNLQGQVPVMVLEQSKNGSWRVVMVN